MSYYERGAFLDPENYRGTKKACTGNDEVITSAVQSFEVYRSSRTNWKKTAWSNGGYLRA